MHPVLLFRCFGFVFGALRIAPGVGWMGSFAWPLIPSWMEPRMPAEDMLGRPGRGGFYCSKKAADEETSDMPEGVRHGEGGSSKARLGGTSGEKKFGCEPSVCATGFAPPWAGNEKDPVCRLAQPEGRTQRIPRPQQHSMVNVWWCAA